MRKILGSFWLKTIATAICVTSLCGIVIGAVGVVTRYEMSSPDTVQEWANQAVATNYMAEALEAYRDGDTRAMWRLEQETNLEVALLESAENYKSRAEWLEKGTLVHGYRSAYTLAKYEFAGAKMEGDIYQYHTGSLKAALKFQPSYIEGNLSQTVREKVKGFVYARDTGIVYVRVESGFYPVQHLQIRMRGDYEARSFSAERVGGLACDTENQKPLYDYPFEDWEMVTIRDSDKNNTGFLTFPKEEKYELGVTDLHMAYEKLYYVNNSNLLGDNIVSTEFHFSGRGIETFMEHVPKEDVTYYYMMSYIRDKGKNDYLTKISGFSRIFPFLDYSLAIHIGCLVMFLISFAYLFFAVGHRRNTDVIVLRCWDRIPYEIYAAVVVLGVVLGYGICDEMVFYDLPYSFPFLYVVVEVSVVVLFLVLAFILSTIVRIKGHKFWQYTILHYVAIPVRWVIKKGKGFAAYLQESYCEKMPLLGKTIAAVILVAVIELLALEWAADWGETGLVIGILVIMKVVEAAILLFALAQMQRLKDGGRRVAKGDWHTPVDTKGMFWEFKKHAEDINQMGNGIALAVEDRMKSERFRAELITNVSHDIKTPLTSIINYVDLIKKEDLGDSPVTEYVEVLDRQSARLKKLVEDLMEASKASTGNLPVVLERCDAAVMLTQVAGEYEELLQEKELQLIVRAPEESVDILADPRHLWRVFDNLLNNIRKYAQPGTRVYINLESDDKMVTVIFRNISRYQLNVSSEELMERFVRGDSSRNTEGSGLGLNITQSLMELMHGTMRLDTDGDLFKVTLRLPRCDSAGDCALLPGAEEHDISGTKYSEGL